MFSRQAILYFSFLTLTAAAAASPWESFEGLDTGTAWSTGSGGSLSTNTERRIHGARSLKWDWEAPESVLTYSGDIGDPTGYVSSFSFWVYLDKPMPETSLRVEFLEGNGIRSAFDFGLDFTGWRTAFVPYRDMEGSATTGIDTMQLRLQGAAVPESGHLFIDQVVFSKVMDSRHQYADLQVPFVREGLDVSHWEPRIEERGRNPLVTHPVDEEAITAAKDLAASVEAALIGEAAVYPWMVDAIESEIAAFGLERTEAGVRGNHIFYNSYPGMAYPPDLRAAVEADGLEHDFRNYGNLMLKIADYYHRSEDAELKARLSGWFLLMAAHLLDQGWADGSNQGCIHHFGYQGREYFKAHFLMRNILEDAGILQPARRAVQWYTRAGQLLEPFIEPNLDYYNTLSLGQMLGLLMETDPARRASWMKAYQSGLSRTLATVMPGDGLGLKPDGTAFHHNGHYPAYAVGAFNTLGFLFEVLRETPFSPGIEARKAFRDALLAARVYSQRYDWPIGLSGRHPFSGNINSLKGAFAALAACPHPGSGLTPDPEMSAAYLRLWGTPDGALGEAISDAGYSPETLEGFWSYPFANHAAARGEGWMASMKGYSTYVWSSEIYTNDNRYGRYQSNGALEILLDEGRVASGYSQSGWDWNRLPGTTGIHLPLDI
ncbi:MAG TPA: chondroitinase family polysaccharide lyase, partial [Oceanipulchritudo sp.]|nr:chondroitinase family polysaccharide lyase [Oceanipulchritudo sp.]